MPLYIWEAYKQVYGVCLHYVECTNPNNRTDDDGSTDLQIIINLQVFTPFGFYFMRNKTSRYAKEITIL